MWRDYLFSTFALITRIPVKANFDYKSDHNNVKLFPIVGITLGLMYLLIGKLLSGIIGSFSTAVLILIADVVLTGGIHLDGLSDTADGLLSYQSPEKMISIMKDSRIGAMGVIAIVVVLLLKTGFMHEAIVSSNYYLLMFMPIWGRLNIVSACYFGRPIVQSKMGSGFIGNMRWTEFVTIQLIWTIIMILVVWGIVNTEPYIIAAVIGTTLLSIFFCKWQVEQVEKKIKGISGDILGAVCELGESLSLLIFFLEVGICRKYF